MGYLRRTSNLERIALSNMTHMMSMADSIVICVVTLRIDSGCSLEKEFIELICMNPLCYYTYLSITSIHVTIVYVGFDLRH